MTCLLRRLPWCVALAIVVLTAPLDTRAGEPAYPNEKGIAIQGFDAVAYFTVGRPTTGVTEFEHEWRGATWRFASQEHLDRFVAEPRRYAPRYGGFCAGAMWRGLRAPVDPDAFAIVDGKLYLAYSKEGMAEFEENASESVPAADANWERLGQAH